MKVEDLMLGDWVCTEHDSTPRQIDWIRTGEVGLFWNKVVTPPYLVPIPITPEILEKNGFVKTGDGWECDENDVVSIALHSEKSCDMWIAEASYEWKHIKYILPYPKCVHELQHVLRLCGINKEIEL